MSRKKVSTTIYITPEQADRLKLLHERTKVPIAVYIREGIDLVLKHYEHVLPGQMTLEAAPPPTTRAVAMAPQAAPNPAPPAPISHPAAITASASVRGSGRPGGDGGPSA